MGLIIVLSVLSNLQLMEKTLVFSFCSVLQLCIPYVSETLLAPAS